jgi:acyl-CoA thioesterase-1
MKCILAFILLAMGLGLTGCKADAGKVDPTTSSNATAQAGRMEVPSEAAPASDRPLIVCFGDSITAGYGVDDGLTYPDDLQQLLDQAGYHYRVVNSGISGNTTKDAVERLPRVLARQPAIVVVEFGGNDALRGLPLEQTQANLAHVIEQLQAAHIKVALAGITIPPDYGVQYVGRFDAIYPALAKRYRVPLLPFVLQNVYGKPGNIQADGIHPTAQGDRGVAQNILRLIKPLLAS